MKLLFICTHNRCRSILAEAIANSVGRGDIIAASAGSSPQGAVHPLSLKYLVEHQIPIDGLHSQSWDQFENFHPDAIVTLCDSAAQEICPIWFDKSIQVHWGLEDPSKAVVCEADQRSLFSNTIDILKRRITKMVDSQTTQLSGEPLRDALGQIGAQIY